MRFLYFYFNFYTSISELSPIYPFRYLLTSLISNQTVLPAYCSISLPPLYLTIPFYLPTFLSPTSLTLQFLSFFLSFLPTFIVIYLSICIPTYTPLFLNTLIAPYFSTFILVNLRTLTPLHLYTSLMAHQTSIT